MSAPEPWANMTIMTNEEKAKKIIEEIIYINIATSTKNGEPWNTPVYSAYDQSYNFYWASDQNGQHSRNIKENSKIFITIYNTAAPEGTGEGVYIQANAFELTNREEVKQALATLYKRKNQDPEKRKPEEFLGEYPRRVYKAIPDKIWINGDSKVNGNFIDIRIEVKL